MIHVTCAASSQAATFESEERAIEAGWLKVSTTPEALGGVRVFWFAPGHGGEWCQVLIREGVLTSADQLQELAGRFVREGRILE